MIYPLQPPQKVEDAEIFLHRILREDRRKRLFLHKIIQRKNLPAVVPRRALQELDLDPLFVLGVLRVGARNGGAEGRVEHALVDA